MNDECKLNGHNGHNVQLERSAWKMRTSGIEINKLTGKRKVNESKRLESEEYTIIFVLR